MRIVHTESSLGWGGQEIRVLTEARGVARRGHEVILVSPKEARIHAEAARFGVEAVALPIGRKRPGGVMALRKFLAEHPCDVLNTHSSTDSWLGALASVGQSRAIVRTRHISAPVPRNFSTRWLYRQAHHIVTTGEKLRLQVIEETGADAARVVSIPTGIDLERFRSADRAAARAVTNLPSDAFIVGIVATLRSWKGHRYLIEAIAKMPGLQLVIVGDGPQREALEKQVAAANLGERVRLVGNRDDVSPWLQSFDLFCLPSYANEGVPQALMQAMACGLPVVTTNAGSIGEIVTDGVSGVIVPTENVDALRSAIAMLVDDGATRTKFAAQAEATARERFGESLMVDRMIAVFERALHG
ncbi:glycosyltransferase family 4 protein [Usitatibacter palustris]|uniref:D-inositol-3-phosphate glycosyltransferase n=1 Tax=Usitatibacter palustris TaxID=2732487 RepID=A0A6M4HCJ5_9PROT|nr:glycosyltransferase family 4 protein [Usitatibacter palustris]QJR16458.1 D-inositol-3-phosphate glycosyltransferase [Usitatibacter palustris]